MSDLINTLFWGDLDFSDCRIESEQEERDLILRAKRGDQVATESLLYAYAPALRRGLADWRRASGKDSYSYDAEDACMEFLVAVLEAIQTFDLEGRYDRIAGVVTQFIRQAQKTLAQQVTPFHIPERTLTLFFTVLRAANGDTIRARSLAPEHGMSEETYAAILSGLRGRVDASGDEVERDPLDFLPSVAPDFTDAVDFGMIVQEALGAMTPEEHEVSLYAYGFSSYNPMSDSEIAEILPMSRPTVQRRRASGIQSARQALNFRADFDVYAD